MISLSIIIPTYNEAGNIKPLFDGLSSAFAPITHEIIFVDDASPDGTAEVIRSLYGFGKTVSLLKRPRKLGLASAVMDGVRIAKGEWLLVMDSDLSHPPETARLLFEKRKSADLVIASRNAKGGGKKWAASRDIISKGAEFLCRPFVNSRTTDPMSGFFLVKKTILAGTRVRVRGYKILLNILYDNPKIPIAEVPYVFRPRHSGKTKLGVSEIVNYLLDLARLLF